MDTEHDHVQVLEMSVLGAVIEWPETIGPLFRERLTPEQFGGPRSWLASVLFDMLADGKEMTPQLVAEECRISGVASRVPAVLVFDCWALGKALPAARVEVEALSRVYLARQVWQTGERVKQAAQTMEVSDALSLLRADLERLESVDSGRLPLELTSMADVLAGVGEETISWVIPQRIAEHSATMFTAEEGAGKSTLLRQLAISATLGIDPFDPGTAHRYEPRRVLLVDCEVSQGQLHRALRAIWNYGSQFVRDPDPAGLVVESKQGGLDLSGGQDQAYLHRLVRQHRPHMVVIGPVYRMTDTDYNDEVGTRAWQRPLEPMRADGLAVVLEHHAGNEMPGHKRALRPIGSSAIRRWVDQGLALRMKSCEVHQDPYCRLCPRMARIEDWRWSREEVMWPKTLEAVAGHVWWQSQRYNIPPVVDRRYGD
jgi:replicative DNA helicase